MIDRLTTACYALLGLLGLVSGDQARVLGAVVLSAAMVHLALRHRARPQRAGAGAALSPPEWSPARPR